VHRDICDWLDGLVKMWERKRTAGLREPMKILMCLPRGAGKSTLGNALDLWVHVRNPDTASAISSYDENQARNFLRVNRVVMEGENAYGYFRELYGVWKPVDDRPWGKDMMVHSQRVNPGARDYSFSIASIQSGVTGSRPDYVRLDDPTVQEKITKEANHVNRGRDHLDSIPLAMKTNGMLVVDLTRYTDADVGAKVLLEEGVREFCPTGMVPREKTYRFDESGWYVCWMAARGERGEPVFPQIWPEERLQHMERVKPLFYATQLMNDPSQGQHMPIERKHVDRLWVEPEHVSLMPLDISIHCDTAFKVPERIEQGCFNVIQVWGHQLGTGIVYYLDGWADRKSGPNEFTTKLVWFIRDVMKGRNAYPFVVTWDKVPGQDGLFGEFLNGALKEAGMPPINYLELPRQGRISGKDQIRVRQAAYGWRGGKVRLVRGAGDVEALVYEMTHIGTSPYNDRRDAAADVFHLDVYTAATGRGTGDLMGEIERPFDELLYAPFQSMTLDERRVLYDESLEREEMEEIASTSWDDELNAW